MYTSTDELYLQVHTKTRAVADEERVNSDSEQRIHLLSLIQSLATGLACLARVSLKLFASSADLTQTSTMKPWSLHRHYKSCLETLSGLHLAARHGTSCLGWTRVQRHAILISLRLCLKAQKFSLQDLLDLE